MNLKENAEKLKTLNFGVEIETYGMGKKKGARLTQEYFNSKYGLNYDYFYNGSQHSDYVATDHKNRLWHFEDDGSISGGYECEIVTPKLSYDDIEDLQELVRIFRRNGAKSNAYGNCGVHIHVDASRHTPKSLRNLVNVVASHENLIKKAIGFSNGREGWAKNIDARLLENINKKKPKDFTELRRVHYQSLLGINNDTGHYSSSRYYILNLHAYWDKGTTEFRCFEFHRNLHAGELKAYIQLCLAMVSYSMIVNYASIKKVSTQNEKCSMKNWLNNLGLIGDEFKTCRKMLLKRLDGDSAYRNGRPMVDTLDDLNLDRQLAQ